MSDTQKTTRKPGAINRYDIVMARIAREHQLLGKTQLSELFSIQQKEFLEGQTVSIEQIIARKHILSEKQLQNLRNATKRKMAKQFAQRALDEGFVTRQQLEQALNEQADEFKNTFECRRLYEILIDNGVLTQEQSNLIRQKMEPVDFTPHGHPQSQAYQNISPENPNPVAEPFEIVVSDDKLNAYLWFQPQQIDAIKLEDIKNRLAASNITHGLIADDLIEKHLQTHRTLPDNASPSDLKFPKTIKLLIAEGKPAIAGKDAFIKYYFDVRTLTAGAIKKDGSIDFKSRGDVPQVKVGDLIAEKIPSRPGQDGCDIYGNSIAAAQPNDIHLKYQGGVRLSADGMKLLANLDGNPNVTIGGNISVLSEYTIDGDVDFRTGNIQFEGNIVVKGVINDDFSIVGGNIIAKEINAAHIHAKGDVIVENGIIGAKIQAEGQVIAKYLKGANIKSYGNVIIAKSVIDSKIRSSGQCLIPKGDVISSLVAAKQGIEIKNIGTEKSQPCTIVIGSDDHIRKIVQGFDYTQKELIDELSSTQAQYSDLVRRQEEMVTLLAESIQHQKNQITEQVVIQKGGQSEDFIQSLEDIKKSRENMIKIHQDSRQLLSKLEQQFGDQEALLDQTLETYTKIENLVSQIERINEQKNAVKNWSKNREIIPRGIVTGQICSGTKIMGIYSEIDLKETENRVMIEEIKSEDTQWEIQIKKLK